MTLELRPIRSEAEQPNLRQLRWGGPTDTHSDLNASVDPWLTQIGNVSPSAIDLVRISAAAYLADRLKSRGVGFSRTIHIHVQLTDVSPWIGLLPDLQALLHWLSGDDWRVTVSAENADFRQTLLGEFVAYDSVSLFSGGLDSFSGAILRTQPTLFVSHTDNPLVTGAQRKAWQWVHDSAGVSGERIQISLFEKDQKVESTTRTRALLFYALAIAAADGHNATRVEVPENGFTSLNLALGNDRGGVLSTRSTHPWTMQLIQNLLAQLGIGIELVNPYEEITKGQLVGSASASVEGFCDGVALTLSCAKLDGRIYKGGNPNLNCGLCVACLTRRAAILAAGIEDRTTYLATSLKGDALKQLQDRRRGDVQAVLVGLHLDIDEFTVLQYGPYPADYDLTAAADLCRRGFAELAAVLGEVV